MVPAAAVDPATVIGGAVGLIGAAAVTGFATYKATVAKTKSDRSASEQAREDTTATARAFDATVQALAAATAEAAARALSAEHKAAQAVEAEHQCVAHFTAHRQATEEQIAAMRGVIDGLVGRIAGAEQRAEAPNGHGGRPSRTG